LNDGLKEAFKFVRETNDQHGTFGIAELYKILPAQLQKDLLNIVVAKMEEALTQSVDPRWFLWLMQSLVQIEFGQVAEPAFFLRLLSKGPLHAYLRMVAKDAKEILLALGNKAAIPAGAGPKCWYAAVLVARVKHWLMHRYQINLKKIEKAMKDGKPVKIAKIQNLDLETVPRPEELGLNDATMDLAACLLSAMRMERSVDPGDEAAEPA
jgi:hypothetical protein